MIVCHCYGVTDRGIRQAIRKGARSSSEVGRACGAGEGCGGCTLAVEEILQEERHGITAHEPFAVHQEAAPA